MYYNRRQTRVGLGLVKTRGRGMICGSKNCWEATTKQNWVCHSEKKVWLWDTLCMLLISTGIRVTLQKKGGGGLKRVGYRTLKNVD